MDDVLSVLRSTKPSGFLLSLYICKKKKSKSREKSTVEGFSERILCHRPQRERVVISNRVIEGTVVSMRQLKRGKRDLTFKVQTEQVST